MQYNKKYLQNKNILTYFFSFWIVFNVLYQLSGPIVRSPHLTDIHIYTAQKYITILTVNFLLNFILLLFAYGVFLKEKWSNYVIIPVYTLFLLKYLFNLDQIFDSTFYKQLWYSLHILINTLLIIYCVNNIFFSKNKHQKKFK